MKEKIIYMMIWLTIVKMEMKLKIVKMKKKLILLIKNKDIEIYKEKVMFMILLMMKKIMKKKNIEFFFILPKSSIIVFFDFLVTISAVYYLIYILYFLCSNVYFWIPIFHSQNIFETFIDVVYVCDLIFPFFIIYYNFDEVLKTYFKDISLNYLTGWFFYI